MTLGKCSCLREPGCDAVADVAADRKNANSAPMHSFRSVFHTTTGGCLLGHVHCVESQGCH